MTQLQARNTKDCWRSAEARKRQGWIPLQPQERAWRHFDFGLLASWTVRKPSSVVLSLPVCGGLLQEPQGMNTDAQVLRGSPPALSGLQKHLLS